MMELIYDFFRWVNDFWLDNEFTMCLNSVMSPEDQIVFAEELRQLVKDKVIMQKDMDIMLEQGDEIRTAIEELFEEQIYYKWPRKDFLRKLMILLKSYGLSNEYIRYVCKRLYPYLQNY